MLHNGQLTMSCGSCTKLQKDDKCFLLGAGADLQKTCREQMQKAEVTEGEADKIFVSCFQALILFHVVWH